MSGHAPPRVIIVGAGFGGLWAARTLARASDLADVLLIDRNNYHTFMPLLYQVAAAELAPTQVINPVRSILHRTPQVRFLVADVVAVEPREQTVVCVDQTIPYDYLILALGSVPHHFGIKGAEQFTFPIRTLGEAIALRNHVLTCFERAVTEADPGRRRKLLTFVIVGGGPTGVELAGAFMELIRGPFRRDYPTLDFREVTVVLLEAADRCLPTMPAGLGRYARQRLQKAGVEVRLGARVTAITEKEVILHDGSCLSTATAVWTAGHRGHPIGEASELPVNRRGQIVVRESLQFADFPNVYVVGDLAGVSDREPLPMVAPVAMQQGVHAARNVLRQIAGEPPLPFSYRDSGMLAVVGRNAAVAQLGRRLAFTGFVAWVLWLAVHLVSLIGFRNRLQVLINWAWSYLFSDPAVRLILPGETAHGTSTSGIPITNARGRNDVRTDPGAS